ncbi:MAG TPA: hypothetical protein VIZ43_17480 [Trebonia sp.]
MNTGEAPGYEFEVPRGPRHAGGPRHSLGHDSLRQLQQAPSEQVPRSSVRAAGSGVLDVMRGRNWMLGLAAPIMAAIAVGIAVVVIAGGGGSTGAAPSALAAGFPPARAAGAAFVGPADTLRVNLSAIGASAGTEVAAGGVNGGPALWTSADGGTDWTQASLSGPALLTKAATGQFAAVAHGPVGWLAVGTTLAGAGGPLVATSANARTWTVTGGIAGLNGDGTVAAGAAAGPGGYVIVGRQSLGGTGLAVATAWYAPGLTGWQRAAVTPVGQQGASAGNIQMMNAVTATAAGFTAVGAAGTRPAAWLSASGKTWRQALVPTPAGSARAALDYVAANGSDVVAAGTEFSAAGASSPFAEVSADAGASWTQLPLPVPAIGPGTGTTVTALTAAGGGFTAAGTYVTQSGPEVVIWTLPSGTPVTNAAAWTAATPQGTGLAGASSENAITALTADGVTLTGVGFTAALTSSGTPGTQQPTLWHSPIR